MMRLFFQRLAWLPALLLLFGSALSAQEQIFHIKTSDWGHRGDPCRVFIGVGTSTVPDGLLVDYTVEGTPARTAGVQPGDVILSLDGVPVRTQSDLVRERDKHQQGEAFTLRIRRGGSDLNIQARFKTCSEEELEASHKKIEMHQMRIEELEERMAQLRTRIWEHEVSNVERDPCKVFIGVYTTYSGAEGGARVTGIIENTPAKISGIQIGDVILALNGVPIGTHGDLTRERDRHQPGDLFTLTVLRGGATIQINARFKSCSTGPATVPTTEQVELLTDGDKTEPRNASDNLLPLDRLEAYPNPTFGPLNIRFEAEAVPTTVRIFDASGRAVYTKELPQFGGYFSEQINLFSNKPGNYVLSIQQGDLVRTKQIVLLPSA